MRSVTGRISFVLSILLHRVYPVTTTSSFMGQEFNREQLFRRFFSCPSKHHILSHDATAPSIKSKRDSSPKQGGSVYNEASKNKEGPRPSLVASSMLLQQKTTIATPLSNPCIRAKGIIPMSLPRIELGLLDSKSRGLSIILQALLTENDWLSPRIAFVIFILEQY